MDSCDENKDTNAKTVAMYFKIRLVLARVILKLRMRNSGKTTQSINKAISSSQLSIA